MSHLKKAQVIMLPTNEKARLYLSDEGCLICFQAESKLVQWEKGRNQHLYVLSDEEIKEGDWMYHPLDGKPVWWDGIKKVINNPKQYGYKKIIATTDTSIRLGQEDIHSRGFSYYLQPSQSFLEVYVREYNKGNVIKEVMVEYELIEKVINEELGAPRGTFGEIQFSLKLKVNPKDNTITIKRVKDNFTIFEIKQALHKAEIEHNKDYSKIWKIMESNFG